MFRGYSIKVYGDTNSPFYLVQKELEYQKPCEPYFIEEDPNTWVVAIHKDLSLCKMRTIKVLPCGDISLIQNLVAKHFKIPDTISEYCSNSIYQFWDVEVMAKFPLGDDYLRRLIAENFNLKEELNSLDRGFRFPAVNLLVDKNGNATFHKITLSTNNIEIDNELIRVAEIICQYKFTPATHRGETVNSFFSVGFW